MRSPMRFFLAVAALVALLSSFPALASTYNIGVLYSGSGVFGPTGLRTKQVLTLWQGLVNDMADEMGFSINLVFADVQSTPSLIWPQCDYLMQHNVSFLVAPEGTMTLVANQYANKVGVPVISRISASDEYRCGSDSTAFPAYSNCVRVNNRMFTYASTVLQPAGVQFRDYYALARTQGASTAATVYFNDDFHTETCTTGAYYAEINKLDVLAEHVIYANYTDASLRTIVADLQALDPDVVTWCRRTGCAQDIAVMKSMNYLPRSLAMVQCTDTAALIAANGGADGGDMRYVNGVLFWTPDATGPFYQDDTTNPYASHFGQTATQTSPQVFQSWFLNATGTLPTYTDASTMAVGYFIETALATSPTNDTATLSTTLSRINANSFWGVLAMDQVGMDSTNAVIVTQVDQNLKQQLLSPTSSATASLIYPMPSWEERVYVPSYAQSSVAKGVIALVAVCLAVYVSALGVIAWHYKNPLVRALNPAFVSTSLMGAAVTSIAVLTWLDDNTSASCAARLPLFLIGLLMIIGPMVAQTWLLARIFQNKTMTVVRATKANQALTLLVVVAAPLVLTVILSAEFPLRPVLLDFDPLRPSQSLMQCAATNSTAATQCGMALLGVFLLVLLAWMRMVFQNRNVKHALFAETKRIALAGVILVFMLGLVMAVEFGMSATTRSVMQTKLVIRGVGILVSIVVSMWILYGSRLVDAMSMAGPQMRDAANTMIHSSHNTKDEATPGATGNGTSGGSGKHPQRTATKPPNIIVARFVNKVKGESPSPSGSGPYIVSSPSTLLPNQPQAEEEQVEAAHGEQEDCVTMA